MVKISRGKVTRRTPCRYGQLNIKCASSTKLHNFHCVDHYHYSDRMFAVTYQIITCLHFSISFVFVVFSNSGEITRPGAMFALTHLCVGKLTPGVRRGGRCGQHTGSSFAFKERSIQRYAFSHAPEMGCRLKRMRFLFPISSAVRKSRWTQ
jgi:hypothetical protein